MNYLIVSLVLLYIASFSELTPCLANGSIIKRLALFILLYVVYNIQEHLYNSVKETVDVS